MATSTIRTVVPCGIKKVWDTVTAVNQYSWRSDLSLTEILNEAQFIEYTKSGYPTTFTTTVWEPCRRWEFRMENSNMEGIWIGTFAQIAEGTELTFTEHVTARKCFLKPFVKFYLKKQQAQFVADLKAALSR